MKRILIRKPGGYDALSIVAGPDPEPGPGEVRVRVKAAGVNYADCVVRMGWYEAAKGLYPMTPGFEFAGTVEAAGQGAENFAPGKAVFGITRFGGYCDCIAVPSKQLWPCPEGWDFLECAAFPAVFLTAWYGLFKAARVSAGETLLVHSAAGGVGTALLQLARIADCAAVAVVGASHKTALCRELGACSVIDRSSQDLWAEAARIAPGGYDAVFDSGGPATLGRGYSLLAPGGRLVAYGFAEMLPRGRRPNLAGLALGYLRLPRFNPLRLTMENKGVIGFNVVHLFHQLYLAREAMAAMLRWIAEGRIRKVPVAAYPLEEAAKAHRELESGKTVGKLVLTM